MKIPVGVKLVAVTKSFDISDVQRFKEKGLNCFGENRIKDVEEKIRQINAEWHLIGHLQSNKVRKAVELFYFIQSVDSLEIARKINLECEKIGKIMPVLIQVNITEEPQKFGFRKDEVGRILEQIFQLKNLKLQGMMMIGKFDCNNRIYFREMKNIFDKYKEKYNLKWLSMGMSDDYKIAIEEGANMIRVGRGLLEIL